MHKSLLGGNMVVAEGSMTDVFFIFSACGGGNKQNSRGSIVPLV